MKKPAMNTEDINIASLSALREQKNISLEAVADEIKVSKDFVRYIETGTFDKLGAPTFLRGHITNYCKTLGINPKLILSQVPQELLQHQKLKTSDAVGASPLARVRRQSNHLGRYVVGTALLGMLGLSFYFVWDKWSITQPDRMSGLVDLNADAVDQADTDKKITYSSLIPQVNSVEQQGADSQTDTALDDSEEDLLPDALPVVTEQDDSEAVDENTPLQAAADSASGFSIKMDLQEQAWVSIKTIDGEKVVHDLIGPGLLEYHSDQPMHFRIGNAKKMQLFINDDAVDLNQLTNKDVADFSWPLNPNS